jgi:hypothetical protein
MKIGGIFLAIPAVLSMDAMGVSPKNRPRCRSIYLFRLSSSLERNKSLKEIFFKGLNSRKTCRSLPAQTKPLNALTDF